MTNLLIVESPKKAKTIAGYLGPEWEVHASVGHVRDLPDKSIGVSPPDFRPEYVFTGNGKEICERLSRVASRCEHVYLGSDDDREGEAIAWHLQQILGLKEPRRIAFGEVTKSSITKAISEWRKIDVHRVASQEARRITDRLVGYQVSPTLQRALGSWDLSAGRVQSVALKIVVELEHKIEQHQALSYYTVEAEFDGGWSAQWQSGEKHFTDKHLAELVAKAKNFTVLDYETTHSTSAPFSPFITSTLQQAASNALKMRPKICMETAQSLYQQGLITYMRTDNPNLTDEMIQAVRLYATDHGLALPPEPRSWKAPEGAQEAHKAIMPTDLSRLEAGETDKEKDLYRLIWLRTVACQLADAEFKNHKITLESKNTEQPYVFCATYQELTKPGYKQLMQRDDTEEAEEGGAPNAALPMMAAGSAITAKQARVKTQKTKAQKRFTEASLIKQLERLGVGRPSSYAGIMETITKERGYVRNKGKTQFLEPTERGLKVYKALEGRFSFMNVDYTNELESKLDGIQSGTSKYKAVLSEVYSDLSREIDDFKSHVKPIHPCPKCGNGLMHTKSAKGSFWSCSGFMDGSCDVALPDKEGTPLLAAQK
ncbi:type I DNA topoisomerase [Stutzerimonas kunmingensis]|uniref:type I DNA topoisomerase n=1 Tax=Stutzerimonas kunmingensis TaxID=1211807 RepID=UPI0028B17774|nr:type I DNA topoisomerase [Stutzerimonas kunmingensis]